MGFPSWGGLLLAAALTTAAVAQSPVADDFARYEPPLPDGAVMRIGSERFRLGFESGQAAFSPDGRAIASASLQYGPGKSPDDGRGHVVEFWEAETGRLLAQRPGRKALYSADGLTVAMLAPDGASLALIASPRNFLDLEQPTTLIRIDTGDWTERSRTELPDSARIDAALQLTDRVLACGENDGQITLRDLQTGAILLRHAAHRSGDLQLERTADGRRWVSLGGTLLVWNNRR